MLLYANICFAENNEIKRIKEQLPKLLGSNNIGTEFVFGFHPCWEEIGQNNNIRIYVSSPVETEVRLTIPYFSNQPFMVKKTKPNDVIEFVLAPNVAQPYTRGIGGTRASLLPTQVWNGRGIIVQSDAPIVVYGVTRFMYTSDGFLALPINSLGKEYIISSFRETTDFTSQSLTPYADIIGVYNKTKVSFYFGGNNNSRIRTLDDIEWKPYEVLRADLNKGDFWLVASEGANSDLGGSMVTANQPISVLSGNHCAYVPTQTAACDFMIEQELPLEAWGKKYYVTPIVDRKNASVIRAFIKEAPTTIYRDGIEVFSLFSNWGTENEGWQELRANPDSNKPTVYHSDKKINIVQYNCGQNDDGVLSDPFQLMLTPEEQFQNEIIFNTPGIRDGFGFKRNYINIVYHSDFNGMIPDELELGEVMLTGITEWKKVKDISSGTGLKFNDPDNFGSNVQVFSKTLKLPYDGVYRLRCGSQKIAAYAYGFASYDSYGFPTSMALKNLEKPDTICPVPYFELTCDGNTIDKKTFVIDEPDNDTIRTNMAIILFDRNNSFNYDFFSDDFIAGDSRLVRWGLRILNPSQDARAIITFSDKRGNDTTIIIEYFAVKLNVTPKNFYFGNLKVGDKKTQEFIIKNESKTSIAYLQELTLRTLKEKLASQGFVLNIPFDIKIPLQPLEERKFSITFTAKQVGDFKDSIGVGDTCFFKYKTMIKAGVGSPIIEVTDIDFGKITLGITTTPRIFTIRNLGNIDLVITGYTNKTLTAFNHDVSVIDSANPLIIEKGQEKQFSVTFTPTAVGKYTDSLIFENDAGRNLDPVCIISGNGVEPQLDASSDDWGRKRVHLPKYDTYPYYTFAPYQSPSGAIVLRNDGTKEVTINQLNIVEDINGEAFEIYVNGTLEPLKNYINNLVLIKDENGNSINVIPDGEFRHIPIYFNPKVAGEHKFVIEYLSDANKRAVSTLTGIGIYPQILTYDLEYGSRIIGEPPIRKSLRFTNLNWEYQDSLKIQSFEIIPLDGINKFIGIPGTEGFSYDSENICTGLIDSTKFPIVLQPGEYIEFEGEFEAVKIGNALGQIKSYSDAFEDQTSHWFGFGFEEKLELTGINEPIYCYNPYKEFECKFINTGTIIIGIPENAFSLENNPNNSFVIDRVVKADNSLIDISKSFSIDKGDTIKIIIRYAPTNRPQRNIEEIHSCLLQIKTQSVTPKFKIISQPITIRTINYSRTTESVINGANEITIDPGRTAENEPVTYSIYINVGNELEYANPTEFFIEVKYIKNFLAVDKNNKGYLIFPGDALSSDWYVEDVSLALDKLTNTETVKIHLKGSTPFKTSKRQNLLKIQFRTFLPWYTSDNGEPKFKASRVVITHSITANEYCLEFIESTSMIVNLTESCGTALRQIIINANDYGIGTINPNPVGSDGTDISFSIAFTGYTEIRIVNSVGDIIDIPISKELKAGNYTLQLPINKLTTGTYFLEIRSGEFNERRKFNVLK